jgi:hypothetical protein
MSQDKVSKLSDVEKNVWDDDTGNSSNVKEAYTPGYSERWDKIRPTKTIVFWIAAAVIVLTIIVGFNWGGWVTGGNAQKMSSEAVVQSLATVCVGQYSQDLGKIQKLRELQGVSVYQRDDYVKKQGWATMPGEESPDNKVASACAKLIIQSGQ